MEAAFQTHIGRVRQTNEDSGIVEPILEEWYSAIVADGMGGHKAGDVASRMAVDYLSASLRQLSGSLDLVELQKKLEDAIGEANQEIYEFAQQHPECSGMGTTLVIAIANETRGVLAHIGDSRIYRCHKGRLELMTSDHTLVNELLKNNQITPEEAMSHPRRNILTRALGTDEWVEADFQFLHWEQGDLLLLCSDGLYGKVPEEEIETILREDTLAVAANQLIGHALNAGGEDNITVALLKNRCDEIEGKGGFVR